MSNTMIVVVGINEFQNNTLGVYTTMELAQDAVKMYKEKCEKLSAAHAIALKIGNETASNEGLAHGGNPKLPEWHAYFNRSRQAEAAKFEELTGMSLATYFNFPQYDEFDYQLVTVNGLI